MKIESIELRTVMLPLKYPFRTSFGTEYDKEAMLVRIVSEGVEGWDIADVFPGGGGNWGGSYLTVPAQGENVEKAQEIAAWLSAPEQQAKAFAAKGTFPS